MQQKLLRAQAALALLIHFRTRVNQQGRSFDRHLLLSLLLASALAPGGLSGFGAYELAPAQWSFSPANFLPAWASETPVGREPAESAVSQLVVPDLRLVREWTGDPPPQGAAGVTLVTQLSLSR